MSQARLAADIGGTFTDVVLEHGGRRHSAKVLTTPRAPEAGMLEGITQVLAAAKLLPSQIGVLVHGTTLATNILLTGRGAKAGMMTTKNFRDIIELRRAMKPQDVSLYNLFIPPARPLIPRSERIGIEERTLYSGEIMTPLNEQETADAVRYLKAQGVESIAVCFLHSYANTTNERRAVPGP